MPKKYHTTNWSAERLEREPWRKDTYLEFVEPVSVTGKHRVALVRIGDYSKARGNISHTVVVGREDVENWTDL